MMQSLLKRLGLWSGIMLKLRDASADPTRKGSSERSVGIAQITRAIQTMEKIAQENAAGSEQSTAAAQESSTQSEAIPEILQHLAELGGESTIALGGESTTALAA